jgi:[acyl-carrier-protein] S-malonyltransferase
MSTIMMHQIPRPRPDLSDRAVLLFPGQGCQVEGMREDVQAHAPDLLTLAEQLVGCDLFAGVHTSTRLLQPAIYCASVAGWLRARELDPGLPVGAHAGHSLGEIAALACAGSLSLEDGLRLVVLRGLLMEQAAAGQPHGGMMAVLGAERVDMLKLTAAHRLVVAGDNAPGQMVLAGDEQALQDLGAQLTALDVTCVHLAIRGAFHSPGMEPIVAPYERAVAAAAPRPPRVPVYSSVTARPFDDIPRRLGQSLTHTVRWRETVISLAAAGTVRYLDMGPGQVLCRLVKRTLGTAATARAVVTWDGTWTLTTADLAEAA